MAVLIKLHRDDMLLPPIALAALPARGLGWGVELLSLQLYALYNNSVAPMETFFPATDFLQAQRPVQTDQNLHLNRTDAQEHVIAPSPAPGFLEANKPALQDM